MPSVGDREAAVTIRVTDKNNNPVTGRKVTLRDTGGSLDVREDRTNSRGVVTFREGVGPPPCNPMEVTVADSNINRESIGCVEGGSTVTRNFTISTSSSGPKRSEPEYPIPDSWEEWLRSQLDTTGTVPTKYKKWLHNWGVENGHITEQGEPLF